MDDLLQDDYDTVEDVNLAEPNEKKDDTATPSERHVPKYQAGESASEAAKLKPPQAEEQVPRNRQVKLQGILSGNNKDGGNMENFQEGYEAHAQNSYNVACPVTGGHFWLTSNYGATRQNDMTELHHSSRGRVPLFGENIQVCYESPAQNRLTADYPHTGGHFSNQLCHKIPAQNRLTVAYPLNGRHSGFASNYGATTSVREAGDAAGKGGNFQGKGTS